MSENLRFKSKNLRLAEALAHGQEDLRLFWESLERHFEQVQESLYAVLQNVPGFAPLVLSMGPVYQDPAQTAQRRRYYFQALVEGVWEPHLGYVIGFGERFANQGVEFEDFSDYLFGYRQILEAIIEKDYAAEPQTWRAALRGLELFLARTGAAITQGYLSAKQQIIRAQERAIEELSTPVLEVKKGLLVMPLIGVMDSSRAAQVSGALLGALRSQRAKVVILDITGLPAVDTGVASHLLKAAKAAKLMGATVLLTGISTETAASLVRLGVTMGDFRTFASLEAGLREVGSYL